MNQIVQNKQPTSRRFMTWLLRSPFHIFMNGFLLITVTGCKSGRTIAGIHLDKEGQPTKPEKFAQVARSRVMIEITNLTAQ